MPKKNGFVLYMESRRAEFIAAGVKLTGGFRQLAGLCSEGWQALTASEKETYTAQAKLFNEQAKKKAEEESSSKAKAASPPPAKASNDPFDLTDEDQLEIEANREIVNEMFAEGKDWSSQPIVICSFNLYVQPEGDPLFLPAEVGLTAMSLEAGVIDNYARIIDPGPIPKGYGIEAYTTSQKLGLPKPGSISEFADYVPLMMILESFLQMHTRLKNKGGNLYVFAFDSDFVLLRRCFEWLFETTQTRLPIKVLSLNLYGWNASENSTLAQKLKAEGQTVQWLLAPSRELETTNVSPYRDVGKSLTGTFIYSAISTTCPSGIFVNEQEVELCVKEVDNFKYYEELCCVYHMKSGKDFHHCALNTSNRYAFSLLEILTLSNNVQVIAGRHYPEISRPIVEKNRRTRMCERWGLTNFEENMDQEEPETLSSPEVSSKQEVAGARGYRKLAPRGRGAPRERGAPQERARSRNSYGPSSPPLPGGSSSDEAGPLQETSRSSSKRWSKNKMGDQPSASAHSGDHSFRGLARGRVLPQDGRVVTRVPNYSTCSSSKLSLCRQEYQREDSDASGETDVTPAGSSEVFQVRGVPEETTDDDDEYYDCFSNPYSGSVPSFFGNPGDLSGSK